jgi:L-Ala-D/L-Glu epimerase
MQLASSKLTPRSYLLSTPFSISRGTKTSAEVIQVEVSLDRKTGSGEGVPYSRYQETVQSCQAQFDCLPSKFDQFELQTLLPPGALRNALDCAFWDLRAKLENQPVWMLAGLTKPEPVSLGYTVSLSTVEAMAESARKNSDSELIKVKLGGQRDEDRIQAVRDSAPNSRLIIDANEGWSVSEFDRLLPTLISCGVELVEQPVPASDSASLAKLKSPIPLCADESLHGAAQLEQLQEIFQFVNVKLDKTGGLTGAIEQIHSARSLGLGVMVGCMVSSSLAIAPAYLLSQAADYSDLDGFASLAADFAPAMQLQGNLLTAPEALWGYP